MCITLSGCKKKDTVTDESVTPPAALAEYHFKANLNGVDYVYEMKSGSNVNMLSISDNQNINGTEMFRFGAEMEATSAPANFPFPVVGIAIQTLKLLTPDVSDTDFFGFIKKGNYPYIDNYVLGLDGIIVEMVDKSGNFFYSSDGIQNNATFLIDVATPKAATIGTVAKVKVRANFNCRLYNINGSTIDVKNAELVIDIENPY